MRILEFDEIAFDDLIFESEYKRIVEFYRRLKIGKQMLKESQELFEYQLNKED